MAKLEKLFNKRKASEAAELEPALQGVLEQRFPSPSFIRPTSSRMVARDEVSVTSPAARRAHSLPQPESTTGFHPKHVPKPSSASATRFPDSPTRPVSLLKRRDNSVPDLESFRFPREPLQNGEGSPMSLASSAISPTQARPAQASPGWNGEQAAMPPARSDTPPASDREDTSPLLQSEFLNKKLPALPHGGIPTPAPSPEMAPVPDSRLSNPRASEILNSNLYLDIQRTLDNAIPKTTMRKAHSHSSLATLALSSSTIPILKEPSFTEFLDLSDDDIAEAQPSAPTPPPQVELPPTPPAAASSVSASSSPSRGQGFLTIPAPFTSRPATAAAYEAARIASLYKFDLVYVVNLWPDRLVPDPPSTPTNSPYKAGEFGSSNTHGRRGMTGRLLAAYGLSNVKTPFRISAAVHTKILQADGWIEYRSQEPQADDFPRGYGCAFYTGRYGRRSSADSAATPSADKTKQRLEIDRGIVFAAFRKQSADGNSNMVAGCTRQELAAVHRDAQALVELLIDLHVANRLRQPGSYGLQWDETGPMPLQRPGLFI